MQDSRSSNTCYWSFAAASLKKSALQEIADLEATFQSGTRFGITALA
jgi:hypothetical protein